MAEPWTELPTISFIIPVLNEAGTIVPLLETLRRRYKGAELLVVDGGSTDNTAELARPLCDQFLRCAPGRARQMNCGASAARGRYFLFLHADSCPSVSASALATYLTGTPVWGFCRVQLAGTEPAFRCISWFMNWRSRLTRVATGDQMLFVRAQVFRDTAGFDEIPLMEDVAYSKRLRSLSAPLVIPEVVATSSRRWREQGVVRTVLQMWMLRLAFFAGVPPARLWQNYYGEK